MVPHAGVGRRVGPRRAPDRRLVDPDQLVEVLEPGDPGVPARHLPRAVELVRQDRREDVVDQGRLARARHPGDRHQAAQRERDVDVVQVVLPRPDHADLPLAVARPADVGHRDRAAAREVLPGHRLGVAPRAPRPTRSARPGRRAPPRPGRCRPPSPRPAPCPRRARRRSGCCRGRAAGSACRSAGGCRAGAGRSRARRGRRAPRPGRTRSASRAGCAGPRRRRACPPRARARGSRARRRAGSRAVPGPP